MPFTEIHLVRLHHESGNENLQFIRSSRLLSNDTLLTELNYINNVFVNNIKTSRTKVFTAFVMNDPPLVVKQGMETTVESSAGRTESQPPILPDT